MAKTKGLEAFREVHDTTVNFRSKVEAGLLSLKKEGVEAWEYEGPFLRRCGIANHQAAAAREFFPKHVLILRRSVRNSHKHAWFASPKVAAKAHAYI